MKLIKLLSSHLYLCFWSLSLLPFVRSFVWTKLLISPLWGIPHCAFVVVVTRCYYANIVLLNCMVHALFIL